MVKNIHDAAGVVISPEFRRCTWGVLWRISHVHEVSYILWVDKTGKEIGIRRHVVLQGE